MRELIESGKISLKMLRYFLVVSQELHFGRAAKKLRLSQPPLSVKIRELEAALGLTLFERNSRNVSLTASGKLLAKECEFLLQTIENSLSSVQYQAGREKNKVKIGVISSALWEGFINILNEFKLRYPSYTFDFIEISPNSQPEAIKNNKIDIGICRFADIQNTYPLSTSLLVAENMCLAVSDTHPMSTRKLVNLKELKDEAFVVLNREKSKSTELILKHCMQADFHANIVYEVIEPQTQLAFVASNQAVAVVPESYANIKWAHIKFIKIAEPIAASLCIIYDEQNEQETVDKILEVASDC